MLTYLAFESRSIKCLLSEQNHVYFEQNDAFKHPLFFKNQDQKSAVDVTLENNQIRSVNSMVSYIIKYQNSFVYSHLFRYLVIDMFKKGAEMTPLLESEIFNYTFDFDEWPATNSDPNKQMVPYTKSLFRIRNSYKELFPNQYELDK